MLHYVYGHDLLAHTRLADSMFRDRGAQFADRLGWAVAVDVNGHERDSYDALDPLYVIWELADGTHGGSMRFLPTTGATMINDHFSHLCGGVRIESPLIWECTRFCISPRADRRAAAGLVLGAGELMLTFSIEHFCGVFDPRMERIYKLYGIAPDVIGASGAGPDRIAVGLWEMRQTAYDDMLRRLAITRATSRGWFERSLHAPAPMLESA